MEEKYVKKIIEKSEIETIKINTDAKRIINNLKKKKQDKINFQMQNQIGIQKGITLLVLVITIIILLILAGITINAITGDNGIIGNAGSSNLECTNVYNINDKYIGDSGTYTGNIITKTDMKNQEFVNELNSYKDENNQYPTEWKKWKLGENGYPTFE